MTANDPALRSWVDVDPQSDFPIQNLPFGIGRHSGQPPRLVTAIGDYVADLQVLAEHGFFDDLGIDHAVFARPVLNDFIATGRRKTRAVRQRLCEILDTDRREWDAKELADFFLFPRGEVELLLPLAIGDYTDFYSSREHATNVGKLFRDPTRALPANWLHLPAAYHGRASTIVVSGTPIRRPAGQWMPPGEEVPTFGPSRELDFELELALVVGRENAPGEAIAVSAAEDYLFGLLLFNDWSARDLQRWEYQPLGPFLGKNFASTVSPWVVTLDALAPFRTAGPVQSPEPLSYLRGGSTASHFDLELAVDLQPAGGARTTICHTNARGLYWSAAQQLAHHTVNGCLLRIGDLLASGTISGPTPDSYGSLLELSRGGQQPLAVGAQQRTYLEDGDTVWLRGYAQGKGYRVGFGEAQGMITAHGEGGR